MIFEILITVVAYSLAALLITLICDKLWKAHSVQIKLSLKRVSSFIYSWLNGINPLFPKYLKAFGHVLLYTFIGVWLLVIIVGFIDDIVDIDSIYRNIASKHHIISKEEIYRALNFSEPEISIDSTRILSFIDSLKDDPLREQFGDLYKQSSIKFASLFRLASVHGFPEEFQNYFLKLSLDHAQSNYEILNSILQRYIIDGNIEGMIKIDSVAGSWKWDLGFYNERYLPQDSLRTMCLYYIIRHLEQSKPVNDSTAMDILKYSNEAFPISRRYAGTSSYICLYFQDIRARYAYQLKDQRADKYTDVLIDNSRRYENLLSRKAHLYSPDRGGDVPGYFFRFFSDPMFIRYKSLLKEKKYKKAMLVLETISSITEDVPFDPDNPYVYIHDTLQNYDTIPQENIRAYAKYDLATISENARLRYLLKKTEAKNWMTGSYLTGVSYLSPTEGKFGSLSDYAFNGDILFSELIDYMAVNYNNEDPRWIYNTALFLKGTSSIISQLIADAVKKSDWEYLKQLLMELKTERVFVAESSADDMRYELLDTLLNQQFGNNIKNVLADCFTSYLDVQKHLSPGEYAIEIVKVPSLDFTDDTYKAVILQHDRTHPIIIELAPAKQISEIIKKGNYYAESNSELYSLIWKSIEEVVHSGDVVYYSPDGALCSINLAALHDENGDLLMDRYELRQCISTKDVLRHRSKETPTSISLFGGIKYEKDNGGEYLLSYKKNMSAYRGVECEATRDNWIYLPGTKSEVLAINENAKRHGITSAVYSDHSASEYQFKSLSGKGCGILHIATHGFYYSRTLASDLTYFERMPLQENPLNRCGLIMSGAQESWLGEDIPESIEDGILLGSEIARMDLSSVNLVVLSACNTGLGDITYEGVSGLQKAFRQAGVYNIMMTLNKVDDQATTTLMTTFYDSLFSGSDARGAYTKAIQSMRDSPKFSDPKYWAPFVLLD